MALTGPNATLVFTEGKSLLVVGRHDLFQLAALKPFALSVECIKQFSHVHPTRLVERNTKLLWTMTQSKTK